MPNKICQELEEIPEELKELFRTVQTGEETDELEDGCYFGLYKSESMTGGRNEHRWMQIGRYDEMCDEILVEYFLDYKTTTGNLSAEMQFSKVGEYFGDSKIVNIPDETYENAEDALHELL